MFEDEKKSRVQCLKEAIENLSKALEACKRALKRAEADAAARNEDSHPGPLN